MNFGPYPGVVRDWHDGDTCHVDIDLGFANYELSYDFNSRPILSCRMFGINAPELSTEAGKTAWAFVTALCPPGSKVTVLSHGWDKYGGRFDGTITLADGTDVATAMVDSGNAVRMP